MSTIKSIVIKPQSVKDAPDQIGYIRYQIEEAILIEGKGIQGDRKIGNPKRSLNVMDDVTVAELAAEGYPTGPGVLGENLLLSGIDLRTLPRDTLLRIGDEAVIKLGKFREPCERLTTLDDRMPETVMDRVGVMCQIARSGKIKVGDPVEIVSELVSSNNANR